MAMTNSILNSPSSLARNVDRLCEDGQLKGELKLNTRKLREFPAVASKYDLSDVVLVDLSKNKFSEIPLEVCQFFLLEQLDCYNNAIRSIPDAIINLQSLTYLNLSRNQLTNIPIALCHLPLQVCILRNNRLVSIPEEIGFMKNLRELDISCNEIAIIPPQITNLSTLQILNLKRNLLVELPMEICQLRLLHLDISANRISSLPTQLRLMNTLQTLVLDQNPMTFPPASLCKRGRIHVFKYLEIQAIKEDKRGIVLETEFQKSFRSPSILSDMRFQNGFTAGNCRKSYTFDSGYNTSDGDSRSQESQELNGTLKRNPLESPSKWESSLSHSNRNQNSSALCNLMPSNVEEGERIGDDKPCQVSEANRTTLHTQTFKEYKESLKLQRAAGSIYKKSSVSDEITCNEQQSALNSVNWAKDVTLLSSKYSISPGATASDNEIREKSQTLVNNQWQQNSVLTESSVTEDGPKNHNIPNSKVSSTIEKYVMDKKTPTINEDYDNTSEWTSTGRNNFAWPKNTIPSAKPVKSSFTMKREFDKAREEQELISDLREILETRLKLKLPEDVESALTDGVFLCHLANFVHANSVTCIHVPSPAVPKLTIAKCRRNVDNFLEACRRLGVPNAELYRWADTVVKQNEVRFASATQATSTKEKPSSTKPDLGQVILSNILLVIFIATLLLMYQYPPPS